MKKFIAWLLVLTLTAAVSIGATLAYLTDTDEDVNVMTLGKVKIDQLEYERIDDETANEDAKVQEFHDNKPLLPAVTDKDFTYTPGDAYVDWEQIGKDGYSSEIWNPEKINNEVDKMVFIKNKGDYDAFVRSVFAFEAGKYATLAEFRQMVHLNLNETDYTWEWVQTPVAIPNEEGGTTNYFVATATYNKVLAPGALTEISLSQIALDKTATNEDVEAFGDTYQILVKSQGIQADGFGSPEEALSDGFGAITSADIPWETDSSILGIDLRTALHYYEGNKSNQITGKVTNVIFGLNKEHAGIVDSYDGTLVDVEQDVDVYVYYVPSSTGYDIYCLADDTIYSPKDSSELFYNMTALQTVDTKNFDVSRAENMYRYFRLCSSLTTVDVSDWDVSNVTNMASLFSGCSSLLELDVSKWDVSNVVRLHSTFSTCSKLTTLDVSKWDTSSCNEMVQTFMDCKALTTVDVSNWDTSDVMRFKGMFASTGHNVGDMSFTYLPVENWDMSSATDLECMFYNCGHLTSLDLSKWRTPNAINFRHTFADCFMLQSIDLTGWTTESVTTFDGLFNDCYSLTELDLSDLDTQSCISFAQFFEGAAGLKTVKGMENWDTSNVKDINEMFNANGKNMQLEYVDFSAFDTSAVKNVARLFNGCPKLTTVYVGDGWDMSNVTSSSAMFSGCGSLVGGAGTTFKGSDLKYAQVDGGAENPGYLTYKAPATANP